MSTVLVAIVGGILAILAAIITHYLMRIRDLEMKEAEYKLERYNDFLASFAEIGSGFKPYEAHVRFENAVNTLNLVASYEVLVLIYELLKYIETHKGAEYSVHDQDKILNKMILEIRRDLHPRTIKNFEQFEFRIISHELRPGEYVDTVEEQ